MEPMKTRKYFIDNLRSLCILLLFPFHAVMMYTDFDEAFYIHGISTRYASMFNLITYPWWMTGLFTLAGISTVYALKHRTGKMYLKERVRKLLIPLIAAIFLVVPVQSYIADIFYNQYSGSYFAHFKVFFTLTDFSGYDGHFTPGHAWFILFLFVISVVMLPLLLWYQKSSHKIDQTKLTMPVLVCLFLIVMAMEPLAKIGGRSFGEFTACFLLGYFVLSLDSVQETLKMNATWLGIVWALLMIVRCVSYCMWEDGGMASWSQNAIDIFFLIQFRVFSWIGILAMLGLGKRFLEFHTPVTEWMAQASFPIYIFHQSVLVIVGFFVLRYVSVPIVQYLMVVVLSFILTVVVYEICRRIRPLRFLFDIKSKQPGINE